MPVPNVPDGAPVPRQLHPDGVAGARADWDADDDKKAQHALELGWAKALELARGSAETELVLAWDRPTIGMVLERAEREAGGSTPIWPELEPVVDLHAKGNGLVYWTAREIAEATPEQIAWLCRGYLARQAITELDGKVKRAGKTTLTLHMVRAILDGQPFLGQPTTRTSVMYLTEQQPGPFRKALGQAGLLDRGAELRIVFRKDASGIPWPELVRQVVSDCGTEYGLLIVDTLGKWSGVKDENDSAAAAAAMVPLQDAAHDGLAILVNRHDRKGEGAVGESGRGSSAFSGDTDIILALRRPEGRQPATRRVIESLSRYDETPEKVVVELTDEGYILLGEAEAVTLSDALKFVSGLIGRENDRNNSDGYTIDELVEQAEGDLDRSAIRRALNDLAFRGEAVSTGRGVKGDPKRFRLAIPVREEERFRSNS